MYAVVGCPACHALWIRSGDAATAQCTRCGRSHDVDRLRPLAEAETADGARDARSALLAERSDHGEEVAGFSALGEAADAAGVDDDTYLAAHDIDVSELADDAAPASRSLPDAVCELVEAMDVATHERLLSRLIAYGHDEERVRTAIDRLVEAGDLLHEDGKYRRL